MNSIVRMGSKSLILGGVSALVLGAGSAAYAQAAAPRASVDEIIVTAQRRAQPIQDVPISIQAFTADTLALKGINNTKDLMATVPGLNFSNKGLFAQPVLRGISTQGTGVDSAVAVYLDGVYMANTASVIFELSDIEGVEVLKGPQGTLYGRNASGGAILLTTKKPKYDFQGSASLSYGSYNDAEGSLYMTGPLRGDFLAASFAAMARSRDGYTDDLLRGGKIGDSNAEAYRLSLRAMFNDNVDFVLSGFVTHLSDPNNYTGIAYNGNSLSRRVAPTLPIATRPGTNTADFIPYTESWMDGATLNGTIDMGWGKLTSTTGYVHVNADGNQDGDSGPAQGVHIGFSFPSQTKSQELSVATKDFGPVSFIFGGMVFDQVHASSVLINKVQRVYGEQHNTASAVYGEAQWKITDKLTGIVGLRYSDEKRRYRGYSGTGPVRPTLLVVAASHTWDAFTPRVSLSYKLNDDVNLYATYNEAFKSGTYNPTALSAVPANPERVKAFEVGAKTSYGRTTFNVAAFHYDFQNMQVASTRTVGAVTASVLNNAASSKIDGLELEGGVWLTDAFKLSGGVTFLHARFEKFPAATANVPFTPAQCPVGLYPCGNFSTVIDVSGTHLTRTPDQTLSLTGEHSARLFGGDLHSSATLYYNSGFPWEVSGRVKQKAYSTLAANIAWKPDAYPIELTLWGRNLTDEVYTVQEADSAGGDPVSFGLPRMVGVRINYKF